MGRFVTAHTWEVLQVCRCACPWLSALAALELRGRRRPRVLQDFPKALVYGCAFSPSGVHAYWICAFCCLPNKKAVVSKYVCGWLRHGLSALSRHINPSRAASPSCCLPVTDAINVRFSAIIIRAVGAIFGVM